MGTKSAHFDIVAKDPGPGGNDVVLPGEKPLLVIEARPPSEICPHFQILAEHLPHHVGSMNPFSGFGVVGAAGRVDVMIAGDPSEDGRIDPAPDLE